MPPLACTLAAQNYACRTEPKPTASQACPSGYEINRCCSAPHVQACVRELSREAVGKLCERLSQAQALPLAKLVPAVAAVGQDYLTPGTPAITRLAKLEAVHSLCAMVYSCGPPL